MGFAAFHKATVLSMPGTHDQNVRFSAPAGSAGALAAALEAAAGELDAAAGALVVAAGVLDDAGGAAAGLELEHPAISSATPIKPPAARRRVWVRITCCSFRSWAGPQRPLPLARVCGWERSQSGPSSGSGQEPATDPLQSRDLAQDSHIRFP